MPGIVVHTHNGRLSKDGGKRLGYSCGDTYFPICGQPVSISRLREEQRRARVAHLPAFADLPLIGTGDYCCSCDSRWTERKTMEFRDGTHDVLVCEQCHTKQRPRPRRRGW